MKLNQEPVFNPKRLKEARLIRGFTISDLANTLGVSKQAISQYELGESVPKTETMMLIINTLEFPRSFFYREFKEQFVGNTFFRANATTAKKSKEVQLNKAKLAGYIYEYLSGLIEYPTLNLPDTSNYEQWDKGSIEDLARKVRLTWGIGNQPISDIVNLLERNGVIVFSVDTDSQKIDAFCQHRKGSPFLFLGNDKQSAFRRQFDGAHELGHILMHKAIDDQNLLSKDEIRAMEEQANYFASAFLMPAEEFRRTVTSSSLLHFVELKKYWNVSIAAMMYRCKDLGIIDEKRYTSLQKQISMKKMRTKEPLDDVFPLQEPIVLKKSINMLIENNVKSGLQLIQEISVPREYIEMLCNLDEGTLKPNNPDPTIRLVDKK